MAKKKSDDDFACTIVTSTHVQLSGGDVVPPFTELEAGEDGDIEVADALDIVGAGHGKFRKGSPVAALNDPEGCDALVQAGKAAAKEKRAAPE